MLFLSTYHNRIDKKGRVSIPAQFRAVLVAQESPAVVAYPSPINECIEGCGMQRIMKFNQRVERFEPARAKHLKCGRRKRSRNISSACARSCAKSAPR